MRQIYKKTIYVNEWGEVFNHEQIIEKNWVIRRLSKKTDRYYDENKNEKVTQETITFKVITEQLKLF